MSDGAGACNEPTVAAVDLGSNTVKMTVSCWDGHAVREIASDARTVRLSAGIEQSGSIAPEREGAALACLHDFAAAARALGATVFIGVATEVVRIAANGPSFLARVAAETPWNLTVITGDDEAALTFEGARERVRDVPRAVIADIGGASTELIAVTDGTAAGSISLPIGSGRPTDRFLTGDPPAEEALARCRTAAAAAIGERGFTAPAPLVRLLVTGGTGIYLGSLLGGEERFSPDRVSVAMQTLRSFPSSIVSDVLRIPVERARVLPAGVAVVEAMIARWSPAEIMVTESGVRRGLLLRYFAEHRAG